MNAPETDEPERTPLLQSIRSAILNRCTTWSAPAVMASIFFAFSLAPSLLPRPAVIQGVLSGVSLAVGYGLGALGVWLWSYLQLPGPSAKWQRRIGLASAAVSALIILTFLWQSAGWQNTVRELMGMEPSAGARLTQLTLVSGLVFGLLLLVSRLFKRVFRLFVNFLHRFLPPRVSYLIGLTLTIFLFWTAITGVLLRSALRVADRSFQQLDAMIEPDTEPPPQFGGAGAGRSLVEWKDLGRQGRAFVSSGPSAEELSEFFGTPTPAPLRVYVGLHSSPTAEERADLALRELIRAGGFDRSILVLATPTGTGWIDPGALTTLEYLHRGDVASVAAQYSYLNSPLSLLTQPEYGAEMAKAVFAKIYGHWRSLPRDARPRLFLHGLSLGAFNSDLSFSLFDVIDDPFDGALWSGPPYRTGTWRQTTAQRNPGTPAWLPTFRDGSVVRFANQKGVQQVNSDWGQFRLVFLQHASDPITFFDPRMTWREPDWMKHPRGHDVTPDLKWFPIITSMQVAADMIVGTAPTGFGHEMAPTDYIEAWFALTEPGDWTPELLKRLRDRFDHEEKP